MADQKALNATFFAFRKREKAVLLPASIAFAVVGAIVSGVFVFLNWQAVMDYINWATSMQASAPAPGQPPSFESMMPPQSVMALGGAYVLFLIVYYVLLAAYEAACLRWMIRGEVKGLFGLALDADTWRVYFTYWIWFLLLIAFYIVCAIILGGFMISLIAAGQGQVPESSAMGFVPLLLMLVILVGVIYFAVRFAPAAATSVARKRFAFFDAWTVTKGRFWAMFGAFLLLFVMFFVFYIIAAVGMGLVMGSLAAGQMGQTEPQTPAQALQIFANPALGGTFAAFIILMVIASFVLYVAMFGVNARAAQAALEEGKIAAAA